MTVTAARPSPTAAPVISGALDEYGRRKLHAALVAVFLVVAHVAMIFGMLDPTVLGWHAGHVMPDDHHMPCVHM